MDKSMKISIRMGKIIIAVFLAVSVLIGIFAVRSAFKPKVKYSDESFRNYIEYKNRNYHSITNYSSIYDFTTEKALKKGLTYTIYSLKGDENTNFLYYSEWQNHQIYTCIENFEEKYPYGTYKKERVTGINLRCDVDLEGYEDYFSNDEKFIDLILNISNYSDNTPASHPLKASSGFTTDIFVYEDNLSISSCNLGHLAFYDGKWIFVNFGAEVQGVGNKDVDTRTVTGIEINDPYAVKMLNEYCKKYFSYIKGN